MTQGKGSLSFISLNCYVKDPKFKKLKTEATAKAIYTNHPPSTLGREDFLKQMHHQI